VAGGPRKSVLLPGGGDPRKGPGDRPPPKDDGAGGPGGEETSATLTQGELSAEQVGRVLETLARQEREKVRQREAARAARTAASGAGRDW